MPIFHEYRVTKSFNSTETLSTFLETEPTNPLMGEFIKGQGVEILSNGTFSNAIFMKDWHTIWLSFALYALIIAVAFAILFKHKHDPKIVEKLNH